MNIVVQRTVLGLNSVSSEVEATALSTELRRYPQYKIEEIAFKHFHETRMASLVVINILSFSHPIQSYSRVPAISDTYMHGLMKCQTSQRPKQILQSASSQCQH